MAKRGIFWGQPQCERSSLGLLPLEISQALCAWEIYSWSSVFAGPARLPMSTRMARNRVSRTPGFSTALTWDASIRISGPACSNCSKTTSGCSVLPIVLPLGIQLCFAFLYRVPRPCRPVLSALGAPPSRDDLDAPGEQEQGQGALYPFLSLVPGVNATPLAFDNACFYLLLWHSVIVT